MTGGKPAQTAFEPSNGNEELVLSDNSALPAPLEELGLDEDTDESRSLGWIAPAAASVATAAWFVGMGWLAIVAIMPRAPFAFSQAKADGWSPADEGSCARNSGDQTSAEPPWSCWPRSLAASSAGLAS